MVRFLALFIDTFISVYGMILFAYAMMSWIPEASNSPLGRWIEKVTKPYLDLFRRFPLRLGMLDLTVYVAFIALRGIHLLSHYLLQVIIL